MPDKQLAADCLLSFIYVILVQFFMQIYACSADAGFLAQRAMLTNWLTDAVCSGGDNYGQFAEPLEEFTTRAEESTVVKFKLLEIKSGFIFTRFS